jgi:hypothetical protein
MWYDDAGFIGRFDEQMQGEFFHEDMRRRGDVAVRPV